MTHNTISVVQLQIKCTFMLEFLLVKEMDNEVDEYTYPRIVILDCSIFAN